MRHKTLRLLRSNTDAANLRCSESIKIAKLLNAGYITLTKQQVCNTSRPDPGKDDSPPFLALSPKTISKGCELPKRAGEKGEGKIHLTASNRKRQERC